MSCWSVPFFFGNSYGTKRPGATGTVFYWTIVSRNSLKSSMFWKVDVTRMNDKIANVYRGQSDEKTESSSYHCPDLAIREVKTMVPVVRTSLYGVFKESKEVPKKHPGTQGCSNRRQLLLKFWSRSQNGSKMCLRALILICKKGETLEAGRN